MANHATRVRSYIDRHGVETVEDFIDACLSLENLIDYHAAFIERPERRERAPQPPDGGRAGGAGPAPAQQGLHGAVHQPPAFLEEQKARMAERAQRKKRKVPEEPQRDVLQFLIEHAPAGELGARRPGHRPRRRPTTSRPRA